MQLKDKVIIVTGAARGIGKVYAKGIAAEGGKVVVSDILDGEETAEEIRKAGGEAVFVKADVTDEKSLEALAQAASGQFGRIDGLLNNAAYFADMRYATFDEVTVEEWDKMMSVNVKGSWLAARAVYPAMKTQGSGKIVNITSGVPFKGAPVFAHYTVSKGAVITLTRVLARSMGKDGICVNAVGPGLTRSESLVAARGDLFDDDEAFQVPSRAIPRSQVPEDIVGAVVFLLSDGADFITGQTLLVDGGSHMN
jgi:NAD(P)-dependent dehydrogenase (short-subunit alcohol dehydrogenase family)